MRRVVTPEILDSDDCPAAEVAASLRDISGINRKFGGVSGSLSLIQRVAATMGKRHFSMLEVGAGFGELPKLVAERLAPLGIALDTTLLDLKRSHLLPGTRSVVGNALALPFSEGAFDLVHCNLFAHHLEPDEVTRFVAEALRVCRIALLINDLVRSRIHLALVRAAAPLLQSYVSRLDGVASVKRAYVPTEIRELVPGGYRVEISRHFLYRMGVIVWKR